MSVTGAAGGPVVIHELMSSPINQLGKSKRGKYQEPGPERETPNHLTYSSAIVNFFSGHSNVMCVSVTGAAVGYEIYRTKREREAEIDGTIVLAASS